MIIKQRISRDLKYKEVNWKNLGDAKKVPWPWMEPLPEKAGPWGGGCSRQQVAASSRDRQISLHPSGLGPSTSPPGKRLPTLLAAFWFWPEAHFQAWEVFSWRIQPIGEEAQKTVLGSMRPWMCVNVITAVNYGCKSVHVVGIASPTPGQIGQAQP